MGKDVGGDDDDAFDIAREEEGDDAEHDQDDDDDNDGCDRHYDGDHNDDNNYEKMSRMIRRSYRSTLQPLIGLYTKIMIMTTTTVKVIIIR